MKTKKQIAEEARRLGAALAKEPTLVEQLVAIPQFALLIADLAEAEPPRRKK